VCERESVCVCVCVLGGLGHFFYNPPIYVIHPFYLSLSLSHTHTHTMLLYPFIHICEKCKGKVQA